MENFFKIENLLTILLTLFYFPNGESMISSGRRSEARKAAVVEPPVQDSQYLPLTTAQPEDLPLPFTIGDSPYLFGWKIKKVKATTARAKADDKKHVENTPPPIPPPTSSVISNLRSTDDKNESEETSPPIPSPKFPEHSRSLNRFVEVDKGSSYSRKGRLSSGDMPEEEDVQPQAPEEDLIQEAEHDDGAPASKSNDSPLPALDPDSSFEYNGTLPSGLPAKNAYLVKKMKNEEPHRQGDSNYETPLEDDIPGGIITTENSNKGDSPSSSSGNKHMSTEIGDKISLYLCNALLEAGYLPSEHDHSNETRGLDSSYLWIPIRQYIPGISRGFILDPPVFAQGCFKWKLKKCGGELVWPLMKPCTFWAPTPLRTDDCGYNTAAKKYKYVHGRPQDMVPGHCMCDWPCIPYFDPFQRCRIETTETSPDVKDNDHGIKNNYKVSHNQALQLCRAITQVTHPLDPVRIPWLPMRVANVFHKEQPPPPCFSWEFKECKDRAHNSNCGMWRKVEGSCVKEEVVAKNEKARKITEIHVRSDCPEGFPCVKKRTFSHNHDDKGVPQVPRDSAEEALIGKVSVWMQKMCQCDWPCLPFFDPINKCYDEFNNLLVDTNGNNYLPSKNYLGLNDEGFFQCTRREDDINCGVIKIIDDEHPINATLLESQSSEH